MSGTHDVRRERARLDNTVSPAQAAACVKAMKPRAVYPYHYFESDPSAFASALQETGIDVRLRDWCRAGVIDE